MPRDRFFETMASLPLDKAIEIAGARLHKRIDSEIERVGSVEEPVLNGAVIFVDSAAAAQKVAGKTVGLCLVHEQHREMPDVEGAVAVVDNTRLAFAKLTRALHREKPAYPTSGNIGSDVHIGRSAKVHPTAIIGQGAEIGENAEIGPYCVVGHGVKIGRASKLHSHVTIVHSLIGESCQLAAGARLGQAGFGLIEGAEGWERAPQLGSVMLGDNVDIGANCTIDRGALGDTVIGDGVKIDNHVHIAHNVRIGKHCILAAKVGIAGSTTIGDRVIMGGGVGIADHLTIGNDVQLGARAGVTRDIPDGEKWSGYPAQPVNAWLREVALLSKLRKKNKTVD